jgi:hypothetical protein
MSHDTQTQTTHPEAIPAQEGLPVTGRPGRHWRYVEVLIEWGFGPQTQACDGNVAVTSDLGSLGEARPLPGDAATVMVDRHAWRSPAAPGRRGVVIPVVYTDALRGDDRTIVTIRSGGDGFSFLPTDLAQGPLLLQELGFFVCALSPVQPIVFPPPPTPSAVLMTERLEAREGDTVVRGWGSNDGPCIYANPGSQPVALLAGMLQLPARSIAARPDSQHDVAIGWTSPLAGLVRVRAGACLTDLGDRGNMLCSIALETAAGLQTHAAGSIHVGETWTFPATAADNSLGVLAVRPGDRIWLVLDSAMHVTNLDLTVSELAGSCRTWDLVHDVAENLASANPHPDQHGHADTWRFVTMARPPAPNWVPPSPVIGLGITSAAAYLRELAGTRRSTVRAKVRGRTEQTWEQAMEALHGRREWPPFPDAGYRPMVSVAVPCRYLTGLWEIGTWQIMKLISKDHRCRYRIADPPFDPLGFETDRIIWALDHLGMHRVARDGLSLWLDNQQADGAPLLTWGAEKSHQIGGLNILWVMSEHYRLTGDKDWLRQELPRLLAAARWILNRRRTTMKETLTQAERDGLKTGTWSPYGLQPKTSCGDGDPTGSRYYYFCDALGYQSVKLLADSVGDVDPAVAAELSAECAAWRRDIERVVGESIRLSPVLKVQDGTCRRFLPQGFQDRGPLALALPEGKDIYSHCGPYHGDYCCTSASIEAWMRSGLLSNDDTRVDGHFDILEDLFLWDHPWFRKRKADYEPNRDWFDFGWAYQSGWERLPEYYLRKDDIPNFLRSWLNRCAVDLNLGNWTFNEHTYFNYNDKSHGNAVFLSNFRNLLAMEIGDSLWLARGTPRAWLEQGKRIALRAAPTYFGRLSYEIVSDVDNGQITATVTMPTRQARPVGNVWRTGADWWGAPGGPSRQPRQVLLRLRHPKSAPLKAVTVNGKPWTEFDKDKETITLKGLTGTVAVTAQY